jgi:hypothetical protein
MKTEIVQNNKDFILVSYLTRQDLSDLHIMLEGVTDWYQCPHGSNARNIWEQLLRAVEATIDEAGVEYATKE